MNSLTPIAIVVVVFLVGGAALWFGWTELVAPTLMRARFKRSLETSTDYRVVSHLGTGREGVVFEVRSIRDGASDPTVAFKVFHDHAEWTSSQRVERLRARIEAIREKRLDRNPAIATLLDCGELSNVQPRAAYCVMEKVEGRTVKQCAARGVFERMPPEKRIRLAEELLDTLSGTGEAGLFFIHVDPENVMMDEAGNFKLIDVDSVDMGRVRKARRRRFHRRTARTILPVLPTEIEGSAWATFHERLIVVERTGKHEPLDPALAFGSIGEMKQALVDALPEAADAQENREAAPTETAAQKPAR